MAEEKSGTLVIGTPRCIWESPLSGRVRPVGVQASAQKEEGPRGWTRHCEKGITSWWRDAYINRSRALTLKKNAKEP